MVKRYNKGSKTYHAKLLDYVARSAKSAASGYVVDRATNYVRQAAEQLVRRGYQGLKDKVRGAQQTRFVQKVLDTPKKGAGPQQLVYNRKRYTGRGVYKGKFKKVKKTRTSIFSRKGVILRQEITGSVDDADCVYVKAEALPAKDSIKSIIAAMLRVLFERNGYHIPSWDSVPISTAPGKIVDANETSATWPVLLRLYNKNMNTGVIAQQSVIPLNQPTYTFNYIVDAFVTDFTQYVAGFGASNASNATKLYCFSLVDVVYTTLGAQMEKVLDTLLFSECRVAVRSRIDFKIQNRTLAADNVGNEADDVSANPIQGRMYLFSGIPKPKPTGMTSAAGLDAGTGNKFQVYYLDEGTRGFNPSGIDASYKEPPAPGTFWNCYKNAYCRLNPGEVKRYGLSDGFKMMYVEKLLMQIKTLVADVANDLYFYNNKKNMMFAFEDVISIDTAGHVISVAWEVERTTEAICSVKKTQFMLPRFTQHTTAEF